MPVIWKFDIPVQLRFDLEMPLGAAILHLGTQNDAPKIWALVYPDRPLETRRFSVLKTGEEFEQPGFINSLMYVGTFKADHDEFIGHLFEHKSHDFIVR
jgi:hypothetical protein